MSQMEQTYINSLKDIKGTDVLLIFKAKIWPCTYKGHYICERSGATANKETV